MMDLLFQRFEGTFAVLNQCTCQKCIAKLRIFGHSRLQTRLENLTAMELTNLTEIFSKQWQAIA